MGEIRIVGPGKTRGYPYPVCKKRIVSPGKTRGYPYPVCKKLFYGIIVQRIAIIFVLIESKMNCPSNTFVSYRLFILYRNSVLKLYVRVLVTFFATTPLLTSMETCCFQILYKV